MKKLLISLFFITLFTANGYSKDISELWNDYLIKNRVERILYSTKQINSKDIRVSVNKQIVTLEGEVDTNIQREIAERSAKSRRGVVHVANFLEIKNRDMANRLKSRRNPAVVKSDRAIVQRCFKALVSNREIYRREIEVNCYNSVVTLKGTVGSRIEKSSIEKIISRVQGVQHVRSKISVN